MYVTLNSYMLVCFQQWATFARMWWLYDARWQCPFQSAPVIIRHLQGLHKPIYHPLSKYLFPHITNTLYCFIYSAYRMLWTLVELYPACTHLYLNTFIKYSDVSSGDIYFEILFQIFWAWVSVIG